MAIATAQEPKEMRGTADICRPEDELVKQPALPKASPPAMLYGSAVGAIVVFAAIAHFFL
jgi:hypothetical protein